MRRVVNAALAAIFCGLLLSTSVVAQTERPKPKETLINGHTMYTLLKPGDIPAIFDPQFVGVADAETLYYVDEPLMVVVAMGEAKGYSTWHLDHHEVVNDSIGGRRIAATW